MIKKILTVVALNMLVIAASYATVKLPGIITDKMVLQRGISNKIWGWADKGEKINLFFNGKNYSSVADESGKWLIRIGPLEAGGPYEMKISGTNSISIKDILIGDVWICSGQSNMEWKMSLLKDKYKSEIETANNPNIRLIDVANEYDINERQDAKINKSWSWVSSENLPDFSAVAYFFAKNLYQKYKVPIGLISSEWGGTVAEAWMSREGLVNFPNYLNIIDELKKQSTDEIKKNAIDKYLVFKNALIEKDKISAEWIKPKFNTLNWSTMKLPGLWETYGLGIDGIVVFRKEITFSNEDLKKNFTLIIPAVDDIDSTFINGHLIGYTAGYDKQRKYKIDQKLLKAGTNTIAIKVLDTGGGGGVYGEKEVFIMIAGQQVFPLAGEWKYKVSVSDKELPPNPTMTGSFPNQPTVLYNSMIAPITNYGIKGAIWYQGESNASKAYEYRSLFPALINDWRKKWGLGDFPFFYVQLANFMMTAPEPSESSWAELREAQSMTLTQPNTGQAVIIDIGEAGNIHPKNKADVGKRLALNAIKVAYGENIVFSGPTFKAQTIEGNKIRLTFDNIGSGLQAKTGQLKYFSIAGEDKKFVWAEAQIENNQIIVSSNLVKAPVAVRYAWADNPEGCNLYNKEGLPASPFRTDDWDGITKGK